VGSFWRRGIVAPRRRVTRLRELVLLAAALVCLAAPILVVLWQRAELLQSGYQIERLRAERAQLRELVRKLRVERASLVSLASVEKQAREELGLVTPPNGRVYFVGPEGVR